MFQTDITGDGTGDGTVGSNGGAGDLLPGTNVGGFGTNVWSQRPEPEDHCLQQHHSWTGHARGTGADQQRPVHTGPAASTGRRDRREIRPVAFTGLPLAPAGAVGQAWLKTFDMSLSWAYRFRDRLELRPGVSFFNLFNFANFDGPAAPFSNILDGTPGSPNGTTNPQPNDLRLGLGSGVNALGSPRVIEFSLKLSF